LDNRHSGLPGFNYSKIFIMFHNLYQLGERQAGEASGAAFIRGVDHDIASQRKQQLEEAAVELHGQNIALLNELEEAGSQLDMPDLIEQFNEGIKGVESLRMWNAHAEPFSWVAYAPARIGIDFLPLDGVRAIHGWRIHWASKDRRAPDEMAVIAYQSQAEGRLRPSHLAVVPNSLPACCECVPRPLLTDVLASETNILYNLKRLATLAYSDHYGKLTNKERGHYISEMHAITALFSEERQHGVTPESLFLSLYLRRRSSLNWAERGENESRSSLILEEPYRQAAAEVLRLAFSAEATEIILPGSPKIDAVIRQSYNLAEIDELFASPTKVKKWFGLRTIRREGRLLGGGSWALGTPALTQFGLHRERIAEEFERICAPNSLTSWR
jgi:hypothetical protein